MGIMHVRVDAEFGIHEVAGLAPRLLDLVRSPLEIVLDLSQVARCDTASVQLLLMLRREANRAGATLRLRDASAALRELLRFYRTESILDPTE